MADTAGDGSGGRSRGEDPGGGGSGEFRRIATYFAPLAEGADGALGLRDDAALIDVPAGRSLVVSTDALVAGVHFIGDEPAALVARKALRVNLSDLAAMGAQPLGYFLSLGLPGPVDDAWVANFCAGLRIDQDAFDWQLMGGDSTGTSGPISIAVTAMGHVASGTALRRSGAQAGDGVFISGCIGDGALGLLAARGRLPPGPETDALLARYRLPEPRVSLGLALAGRAHAAIDVSDGLIADLGHLCAASGVGARIAASSVPLSDAAAKHVADAPDRFADLLTGGDDYELLIAGPEDPVMRAAEETGIRLTRIGEIVAGDGVVTAGADGAPITFTRKGWQHG